MNDIKDGCIGCLGIIAFLVAWWFVGTAIRQCECAVLKIWDEEPPYYTTDDDLYHRQRCPYITEDNMCIEEYDSREEAEEDGFSPCPHCLD